MRWCNIFQKKIQILKINIIRKIKLKLENNYFSADDTQKRKFEPYETLNFLKTW